MKAILKYLFFDTDVVENLRKNETDENRLYNLLNSGRITLEEYLSGVRSKN